MAFTGKWSLTECNGVIPFLNAIKSPPEYINKMREIADEIKNNPNAYVMDIKMTTNTIRRITIIHGETKRDSGEVTFGVEKDATADDGRTAKIKVEKNSDTKLTRFATGDGFTTVTTFETSGNTLTMTANGNGASCTTKYKKL